MLWYMCNHDKIRAWYIKSARYEEDLYGKSDRVGTV